MDSLAERIINGDVDGARDDLGLPLPASVENPPVDYMVKRILIRYPHLYQSEAGTIFLDRIPQRENSETLVKLSNTYNSYARGSKHVMVWNRLHEVLPVFDDTKLWITPTLLWNMETCDFEEQEPQENYI